MKVEYSMKDYEKATGIRWCLNHTGKMSGMISLSTSSTCNAQCQKNAQVEGSICQHCYSESMQKMYKGLKEKLVENAKILTAKVVDTVPFLNNAYDRFEAFGDLANEIQFENYVNICKANPQTNFALWTKNPSIVDRYLKGDPSRKPSNLNIGVSSMFMNKLIRFEKYEYFTDFYFTVYSLDYIKDHPEIKINCGGRLCMKCLRCYKPHTGEPMIVNELLKSDQKKAIKLGFEIL